MFFNYLKTAWRNIKAHRSYAIINILGLSIGMAASVMIYVVIHYELSYDGFESKKDRIIRVVTSYTNPLTKEVTGHRGSAMVPLAKTLRNDIPSLEKVASVWFIGGAQVHVLTPQEDRDEKLLKQDEGLFWAEPELFSIFDFDFMAGNPKSLDQPNTCVLNQTLARTYFGDWKKAMGRTIQIWSFRIPMRVVGVYKDLPASTDLEIKLCGSYATFKKINPYQFEHDDWSFNPWPLQTFALLPKDKKPESFTPQLASLVQKYIPAETNQRRVVSLSLQPLSDLHLSESFGTYKGDALTHNELWSLALIGFFLLLVACVNFINLATAQSVKRAREIGVRKVLGSSQLQILKQFLNETAVITALSLLLGFVLCELSLPFMQQLTHKDLSLDVLTTPSIVVFIMLLGFVVNLLAGFYPGMVLAGFRPIEAIKNKLNTAKTSGVLVRKGLVVFQFVIAQFLIIGTVVVLQQMRFFRNQPMGFDKESMAFIDLPSDSTDQTRYSFLKEQLLKIPGVDNAGFMMDAPAGFAGNSLGFYFNNEPIKKDYSTNLQFADTSYASLFKIPLVAGRMFYQADTVTEVLVNQTFARKLGFKNDRDILGKTVSFDDHIKYPVVGVLQDYHNRSLKEAVAPLVVGSNKRGYGTIGVKLKSPDMSSTLAKMQKTFTQIYPSYLYTLDFMDERLTHFYTAEAMASSLFNIAAFFAIFISCLGLYGLVSFMAIQKTKEVGIRKVLGASVQSIVYLFSKEFVVLVGIAFVIAAPMGYILMQKWLNGFHFHIALGWTIFAAAIVLSLLIAGCTVGYKAIRAALANPVKSLRTE